MSDYQTAALTVLDEDYATFTGEGVRISIATGKWIALGRPSHVTRFGDELSSEYTFYSESPPTPG